MSAHHGHGDRHEHDLGLEHDLGILEGRGLPHVGIVRRDITSSLGAATGVAAGVPLALRFRVQDLSGDTATLHVPV